ncbi:MAG: DUF4240 domain-containing protein [Catenulispora sp.]
MDTEQFWQLIDDARATVSDPSDVDAVAEGTESLLARLSPDQIVAAEQVFWDLMSRSYQNPLWAAAYVINGGCSDDGFDYFRGWLVLQGRKTFDQAVDDPDSLADVPVVQDAAAACIDLDGETALGMASRAFTKATGQEDSSRYTVVYPDLDPSWNFDFDDSAEMRRRLPRLTQLYRY